MVVTHRYGETGTITTGTAGALSIINFRANGMYDPYATGTGHQPMYFDQMSALYNHWTVIGSKITVTFCQLPDAAGTRPPVTVGCFLNDDTTSTGGFYAILENAQARHKTMTQNTGVPVTIVNKYSAKKNFGGSIVNNSLFIGTIASDPAEQMYYTLFAESSASITACTVMWKLRIDYIAVWTELKDLINS